MPIAHDIGLAPYPPQLAFNHSMPMTLDWPLTPAPISSAFYVYNYIRLGQAAAYGPKLPFVGLIIARPLIPQTSHRWHRAA